MNGEGTELEAMMLHVEASITFSPTLKAKHCFTLMEGLQVRQANVMIKMVYKAR